MAFLVEDGTGLEGANSYDSVADFKTYHEDRGNNLKDPSDVDFPDDAIQQALIRASDYLDKRFAARYRGFREKKNQGLEWPRLSAFDNSDYLYSDVQRIPVNLKRACDEYALRALRLNPLAPDPTLPFQDRGESVGQTDQNEGTATGEITSKKEKVDVIEESTGYATMADSMSKMNDFVDKGGGQVPTMFIPTYPEADMLLKQLIRGGASRRLGRGG